MKIENKKIIKILIGASILFMITILICSITDNSQGTCLNGASELEDKQQIKQELDELYGSHLKSDNYTSDNEELNKASEKASSDLQAESDYYQNQNRKLSIDGYKEAFKIKWGKNIKINDNNEVIIL